MGDEVLPKSARTRWGFVRQIGKSGQSNPIEVRERTSTVVGILKAPIHTTEVARERFRREVAALQRIEHPNVVTLLDADLASTPAWYVSPRGVPLPEYWREFCEKHTSPAERFARAAEMVGGLLDGLVVVHAAKLIHRDIKPQNIVVIEERCVLIDFGMVFDPEEQRLTEAAGHPVANRFVGPDQAPFGAVFDPTPWWDCLQVAWVWAWMLEDGAPRFAKHWKYHPFIQDARCAYLRAVLAATTVEELAPKDAAELQVLCRSFGLLPGDADVKGVQGPEGARAAEAVAEFRKTEALKLQRQTELAGLRDAVVPVASIHIEAITAAVARVIAELPSLPIAVTTRLKPKESLVGLMSHEGGSGRPFEMTLRTTPESYVGLDVAFRRDHGVSSILPLIFRMRTRDRSKNEQITWCISTDGRLLEWRGENYLHDIGTTGDALTPEEIAEVVRAWVTDRSAWTLKP